jgi:hypothetical protein
MTHGDAERRSGVAKIGRGVASRQGGFFDRLGCFSAVAARADAASEKLRSTGRPRCTGRVRKGSAEIRKAVSWDAGDVVVTRGCTAMRPRHGQTLEEVKALLAEDRSFLRPLVEAVRVALHARGRRAPNQMPGRAHMPGRFDPGPSEPTWNPQPSGRGELLGREYRTNPKPAGNLTDATIGADALPGQQPNGRRELLGRNTRRTRSPQESWRIPLSAPVRHPAGLRVRPARSRPPSLGGAGTDSHGRMDQPKERFKGRWLRLRCCADRPRTEPGGAIPARAKRPPSNHRTNPKTAGILANPRTSWQEPATSLGMHRP